MRTALLIAALAASASVGRAQAQLVPVDGVLLVRSEDPAACLAMERGAAEDAALFGVLEAAAQTVDAAGTPLRAIAFDWAHVGRAAETFEKLSAVAAGVDDDDVLDAAVAEATSAAPGGAQPSVVAFPDRRVVSDIAACPAVPAAAATTPPAPPTGRAWFLPLEPTGGSEAVDRGFAPPDDFDAWLEDVAIAREAGGARGDLALCLLVDGALARQPAFARRLLAPTIAALEEAVDVAGMTQALALHAAPGLVHPFALSLRSRDAILVADVMPARGGAEPPAGPDCASLMARTLGLETRHPLGGDLRAIAEGPGDCDVPFAPGEQREIGLSFEYARYDAGAGRADTVHALDCLARRLAASDADLRLTVEIEGYASLDGGADTGPQRFFSRRRAATLAALARARLAEVAGCAPAGCARLSVTAAGFGGTALFTTAPAVAIDADPLEPDSRDNQVAVARVTASAEIGPPPMPLDGPVSRRFLAEPGAIEGACAPGRPPISRGSDVIAFLDGRLGRELSEITNPPPLILLLHNQLGVVGDGSGQQRLADALYDALAARRGGACTAPGTPQIGYLYRHEAPIQDLEEGLEHAYYLLPPKLIWIYEATPALSRLPEVAETYRLRSRNNVSFRRLWQEEDYRRPLVSLIDTLVIGAPVPVTEVLRDLDGIGTGWVDLDGTWD